MRATYLYRVRVIKYPEGSEVYGWAPENWEPYIDGADPFADEAVFSWPNQRQYLSKKNADGRAELFRKYGAEVVVERSDPITWPEPADNRLQAVTEIVKGMQEYSRRGAFIRNDAYEITEALVTALGLPELEDGY